MQKTTRLRLLSNALIVYTLLAGGWWSFLLNSKIEEAYSAQKALIESKHPGENIAELPVYKALEKHHQGQHRMLLGEGSVLLLIFIFGVWWVRHSIGKEAELADRQRNFLLSVTHELKSPLASIKLVLETIMKRQLDKPMTDRMAGNALFETDRLHSLVENLLLAARLESAYKPYREDTNVSALLENLTVRFKNQFAKAKLVTHISPNVQLYTDPEAITSITLNLLENAVKYAPESSEIVLSLFTKDQKVVLEVADQGYGIPDLEKPKIFERFYRVGNEDTRQAKGAGLGLFIVKGLATSNGGKISLRDNLPQGSVFTVSFER